jgi:hypothetical protein
VPAVRILSAEHLDPAVERADPKVPHVGVHRREVIDVHDDLCPPELPPTAAGDRHHSADKLASS